MLRDPCGCADFQHMVGAARLPASRADVLAARPKIQSERTV